MDRDYETAKTVTPAKNPKAAKPTSKAASSVKPQQGTKALKPFTLDMDEVIAERDRLLATRTQPHGTEAYLVQVFMESMETGHFDERLPITAACSAVCEQPFKYGRADIVIYHCDGSVSVIEAKNGDAGYTQVVSGIGQSTLYAVQIATKGIAKKVRRCLLWSGTGDSELDAMIDIACTEAGVISLSMPTMRIMTATREAIRTAVEEHASYDR